MVLAMLLAWSAFPATAAAPGQAASHDDRQPAMRRRMLLGAATIVVFAMGVLVGIVVGRATVPASDAGATSPETSLLDLAAQMPAVVLSKLLGIHINTATQWTHRTGALDVAYAAELARRRPRGKS
jgi:hypothetical protein